MKAYVLTDAGCELVDIPEPIPHPGQVVVQTTAAGLCHSDLTLAARPPDVHPFDLPIVLGHELAGTVVEVPAGTVGVQVGDAVVGYGPRGCRSCAACRAGAENYCRRRPADSFPPGLGTDGALAEYVAVDADHVMVATGIPPAQAAALTDAGLTAFHALNRALDDGSLLTTGQATVVVIGVGGLGHAAVQLARLAGAVVVAVDRAEDKLALARSLGSDYVLSSGPELVSEVRELTQGHGADVVIDLVASDATLRDAAAMLAVNGVISLVGVGSGRLPVGMHALPLGTRTDLPYWGTRPELDRVLELTTTEQIRLEVEEFSLERTPDAYARLDSGQVLGRAVAVP